MVTMHDVLDAQWMLDNHRDGEWSEVVATLLSFFLLFVCFRKLHEKSCETSGGSTDLS